MRGWSSVVLARHLYLWFAALGLWAWGGLNCAATDEAQQHFEQGYAYEQKGMRAHAMREYRAVLGRLPHHRDALLNLAALYRGEKHYDRVLDMYRKYLEFYPDSVGVRLLQGNAYVESRRYEDAIAAYEEITTIQPHWAAGWGRLGYAYSLVGQFKRATESYRRTLEINPDSSLVRYHLALLLQRQDHTEAAIKEYHALLQKDPDNPEFHTHLANLLIKKEEAGKEVFFAKSAAIQTAESHLRQAVQQREDYAYARLSLGLVLSRQKRYAEAIEEFEKVLELTPDDYQVHSYLGNLYKRLGKEQEAKQHLTAYSRTERGRQFQSLAKAQFEEHVRKTLERLEASMNSRVQ